MTRLTKTVQHLVAAGDEVMIFCPEGAPESYMGAQVVGVPAMPLPLYPELKLALPRPSVSDALEAFAPDLVHVVNPAVLGLGGIWLAKTKGYPLVASYHTHLPKYLEHYGLGMLEPVLWELLKMAHNQAQLNLCTSTAMVAELSEKGIQHTDLWQRGVDTDQSCRRHDRPAGRGAVGAGGTVLRTSRRPRRRTGTQGLLHRYRVDARV